MSFFKRPMQNLDRAYEFALLDSVYVVLFRTLHRFLFLQTIFTKKFANILGFKSGPIISFFQMFFILITEKELDPPWVY